MKEVLNLLDNNNITYKIVNHDEIHTIEDIKEIGLLDKGYICKNLFLRNTNGKMNYVFSCVHSKSIKLDDLAKKIGSTKLSFGSA